MRVRVSKFLEALCARWSTVTITGIEPLLTSQRAKVVATGQRQDSTYKSGSNAGSFFIVSSRRVGPVGPSRRSDVAHQFERVRESIRVRVSIFVEM